MIEKVTVAVATCDACGKHEYADDVHGEFSDGYSLTIVQHASGTGHEAFACKETHISKAARKALEEWQWDGITGTVRPNPPGTPAGPVVAHNDSETSERVIPVPDYDD
jgi:hypothetical protein